MDIDPAEFYLLDEAAAAAGCEPGELLRRGRKAELHLWVRVRAGSVAEPLSQFIAAAGFDPATFEEAIRATPPPGDTPAHVVRVCPWHLRTPELSDGIEPFQLRSGLRFTGGCWWLVQFELQAEGAPMVTRDRLLVAGYDLQAAAPGNDPAAPVDWERRLEMLAELGGGYRLRGDEVRFTGLGELEMKLAGQRNSSQKTLRLYLTKEVMKQRGARALPSASTSPSKRKG